MQSSGPSREIYLAFAVSRCRYVQSTEEARRASVRSRDFYSETPVPRFRGTDTAEIAAAGREGTKRVPSGVLHLVPLRRRGLQVSVRRLGWSEERPVVLRQAVPQAVFRRAVLRRAVLRRAVWEEVRPHEPPRVLHRARRAA